MKTKKYLFVLLLLIFCFSACDKKEQKNDDLDENGLIIVNTKKEYSKKDIDWAENAESIEYIPLETNKDFLTEPGSKIIGFTDDYIIYSVNRHNQILIFDRQGKALRKIAKQGNGPEEYLSIYKSCYDDKAQEVFIHDIFQSNIKVYNLYGDFLRSFPTLNKGKSDRFSYQEMENYNEKYLICYVKDNSIKYPFFLISKQDGKKYKDIKVSYVKKLSIDKSFPGSTVRLGGWYPLIKSGDGFVLKEPSSDTLYYISPSENSPKPLIIQTPSVQETSPPTFLVPRYQVDNYLFIQHYQMVFDSIGGTGFPGADLFFDYRDQRVYEHGSQYYNNISFYPVVTHSSRHNVLIATRLADRAIDAFKDNEKIDKRLRDIVSTMDEDDNQLLIVVTLKE